MEEIELLREEMRRVLQFLRWHAHWWVNMAHLRALEGTEREGVIAYATRQANICRDIAAKFELSWARHLTEICELSSVPVSMPLPDLSIPELPPP